MENGQFVFVSSRLYRFLTHHSRFQRTGKRSEIFLATKFGLYFQPGRFSNGSPEYARQQLENSLRLLGTDYIDLWYLHRPDPTVPIEVTIGVMAEYVK